MRLFASSLAASTAMPGRPLLPSPYLRAPPAMIPPAFIPAPPHPIVGYGPPPPPGVAAPNYVPLAPPYSSLEVGGGGNPLEVRAGTVYFGAELQKLDATPRVGTIYFDPSLQRSPGTTAVKTPVRRAKSAIPIVDPQVRLPQVPVVWLNGLVVSALAWNQGWPI